MIAADSWAVTSSYFAHSVYIIPGTHHTKHVGRLGGSHEAHGNFRDTGRQPLGILGWKRCNQYLPHLPKAIAEVVEGVSICVGCGSIHDI